MTQHFFRFGLVGHPLGHSVSPVIHAAALRSAGLVGEYHLYPVDPMPGGQKTLIRLLDAVRNGKLDGLNITIPHKQSIVPFLDRLTLRADRIGAVNTVYRQDSNLIGENTDAPGFMADVLDELSGFPEKAIILGAGGAARAVLCALMEQNCEVFLAARRVTQAEQVVEQYRMKFEPSARLYAIPLEKKSLRAIADEECLIVNTTPVGMYPVVDCSPWPKELSFPEKAIVYDTVYNPRETRLVSDARSAGLRAVSGLGMLVQQAGLSFSCWTGIAAPIEEMRMAAEDELRGRNNL